MKRVILIILDGVGIGYQPDADKYGDIGSNTLKHIAESVGGLKLPNLEKLGLGKIIKLVGMDNKIDADGNYGKLTEISAGKDSTTGHWEIAGLHVAKAFPTYPNGFPETVILQFEQKTGKQTIGNIAASGTEIIKNLGDEHMRTGKLIVYTSADSVFQIAANTDIVPLQDLYKYCRIAREILVGEHAVARVIARPFKGSNSKNFERTKDRKDFSVQPFSETMHHIISKAGIQTVGIGKINDLYAEYGIKNKIYTKSNSDGMQKIIEQLKVQDESFIMANLVDFDSLYGHRNDVSGFYKALEEFDIWLPELLKNLSENDVLIITADHGNDPTYQGTDHTREYVPLLVYGKQLQSNINLGTRKTFADIQATITDYFNVPSTGFGKSFLKHIMN